MSQEAIFGISIFTIALVAFGIAAIVETIGLKKSGWGKSGNVTFYTIASNAVALIVFTLLSGALVSLFILLFSATLDGAFWLSILSLVLGGLASLTAPLLIFLARQSLRHLAGLTELTWKYSLGLALADSSFVIIFIGLVFVVLTGLSSFEIAG